MAWLNPFSKFFSHLAVTEAVLIVLSVLCYRGMVKSHEKQLGDRQHEIDWLANNNHHKTLMFNPRKMTVTGRILTTTSVNTNNF